MKEVKKHIQNWKDIRIADIPKLGDILLGDFALRNLFKERRNYYYNEPRNN